jgi:two-component system, sensor histidine kinase and response regulator
MIVRLKALVVDDEPAVREVIVEYLEQRGYEVLEAGNGLEALLSVKRGRPSVVILDLGMPRLGGLEALKRIRAFDSSITTIVVTGESHAEIHRQARVLGAAAVLSKPIDLGQLEQVLEALGVGPVLPGVDEERPSIPESASAAKGTSCRVLVVDDDADVRATLQEMLVAKGYRAQSAADAADARRAISAEPPDVILLDIEMPGLSGTEALPAIRAVAPQAKIIMISGTIDVETAKRALALGAFDYVVKPMDLVYLDSCIAAALAMTQVES